MTEDHDALNDCYDCGATKTTTACLECGVPLCDNCSERHEGLCSDCYLIEKE